MVIIINNVIYVYIHYTRSFSDGIYDELPGDFISISFQQRTRNINVAFQFDENQANMNGDLELYLQ